MIHTTWIEISKSAFDHNINQYKLWLPAETSIAPVVKANSYGHGLKEIGMLCQQNSNVTRVCVANTKEGVDLRKYGITKPILVLGFINTPPSDIVTSALDIIVSDAQAILELNNTAKKHNAIINIHLKIDTGLSRMGIHPSEFSTIMQIINSCTSIKLQGICSHLIESFNQESVNEQEELLSQFARSDLQIHTSNSNGCLVTKNSYSFARIGAGIYGYLPEAETSRQELLRPVLSLKTRVIGIKKILAGDTVGYGRTYTATKPTTLAILGMGYYEGIDPDLANTGRVLIHGQYAHIVGRVNMNYFTVDVTNIADVKMHDIVTVLGHDGDNMLSAYNWRIGAKKNVRIFLARLNTNIAKIITK